MLRYQTINKLLMNDHAIHSSTVHKLMNNIFYLDIHFSLSDLSMSGADNICTQKTYANDKININMTIITLKYLYI